MGGGDLGVLKHPLIEHIRTFVHVNSIVLREYVIAAIKNSN